MVNAEYGFYTDTPENFPNIDTNFESPEIINNAIVEFQKDAPADFFPMVFKALSSVNCRFLEIRVWNKVDLENFFKQLKNVQNTALRNIDILLSFENYNLRDLIEYKKSNLLIGRIFVHSFFEHTDDLQELSDNQIFLIQEKLTNNSCGIINPQSFSCNLPTFLEALHFNSCLNIPFPS